MVCGFCVAMNVIRPTTIPDNLQTKSKVINNSDNTIAFIKFATDKNIANAGKIEIVAAITGMIELYEISEVLRILFKI